MIGASAVVTLLTLVVSVLSFANQVILAKLFGANSSMDALLLATSLPLFAAGTLLAVLSYSLVPTLVSKSRDPFQYEQFVSLILVSAGAAAVIISLVGSFSSPLIVHLLDPKGVSSSYPQTVLMAQLSWVSVGLALVAGVLSAIQNAAKRFYAPVIAGMAPYVLMILLGLTLADQYGPVAVTLGMLLGYAVATLALLANTLGKSQFVTFSAGAWDATRRFACELPVVALAMMCFTVYQSVDAYWAARLGPSHLSHLGYSQRIIVALGTLIVAGPSAVLAPFLAERVLNAPRSDFIRTVIRAVRMLTILAAFVTVMVSLLAPEILTLVFERGAFDKQATASVASILPVMLLGMIPMLAVVIIFRALFAQAGAWQCALLGVANAGIYFTLSGLLSSVLSTVGIAIAYAISWWITFIASTWVLCRADSGALLCKENLEFLFYLGFSVGLTAVAVLGSGYLLEIFVFKNHSALIYGTAAQACIGTLIFYGSTVRLFRMPDAVWLTNYLALRAGARLLRVG